MPAFTIPDGATMTISSTNTPLIVKALDTELRLSKINDCTGVALSQPTATATLPSKSDLHDPTRSTDIDYIGIEPTVANPPKVIDGVGQ